MPVAAQDYTEIVKTKGYVAVEDQQGPGSELKRHPSELDALLPQPTPMSDEEISLEPETFVFSASGFPPDPKKQNCPFHLVVKAGYQAPNALGQIVVQELSLVANFELPGCRFTTPSVAEREAMQFAMMRRRGDTVKSAKKESAEAAKQDIIDLKKALFNCLEWRAGKLRRLSDVTRPQTTDVRQAIDVMKAIQDAGLNVADVLARAGIHVEVADLPDEPEQEQEPADGEGAFAPSTASQRIPPHPVSNMA